MARYFFNLVSDEGRISDAEGSDLPGLEAARDEARLALIDLIVNQTSRRRLHPRAFEITDGQGHVVAYVSLAETT